MLNEEEALGNEADYENLRTCALTQLVTTLTKNYATIAITTEYWKPGCDYLAAISSAVKQKLRNGDVLVLSEKAISVAEDANN